MVEVVDVIEEGGRIARGLTVSVRVAVRDDGTGVLACEWDPAPPERLKGVGLSRFQAIRDRALERAAEAAGHPVEVVVT